MTIPIISGKATILINHIPQKTPSVRVSSSSSQQGRVETRSSTLGRQTHRLVFKAQKTKKNVTGGQFKDKKEMLTLFNLFAIFRAHQSTGNIYRAVGRESRDPGKESITYDNYHHHYHCDHYHHHCDYYYHCDYAQATLAEPLPESSQHRNQDRGTIWRGRSRQGEIMMAIMMVMVMTVMMVMVIS